MRTLAGKLPGTMRRDPGESGSVTFGFVDLPEPAPYAPTRHQVETLPGRLGATERTLLVERTDDVVTLQLSGWFKDTLNLTLHQAEFIRDALTRMLSPDD